jgi:uncharacterized protein (TIGR02145 family)
MKRNLYFLLYILTACITLQAQVPHKFNYQAIMRDADGLILADQDIGLKISILKGNVTGTVSYCETHLRTSNPFGLINIEIGGGTVISGALDTISWGADTYYLKLEADPSGGTEYTDMGTIQLLAVPYALYAEKSSAASASTMIQDADGDTRVTTEASPGDNRIRFYTGDLERLRMTEGRLELFDPNKNIFIGEKSGINHTTGVGNVNIGHITGRDNTTGSYNTFVGDSTGVFNTEGENNTFIGAWSGVTNTTGAGNTFLGADAGEHNESGSSNVFLGWGAGYGGTMGNNNTFAGVSAGVFSSGSFNTYLGQGAGAYNSGNFNVFIGRRAGRNEPGSNKLYIESSSRPDPLIYGEFDNRLLHVNVNDFYIGVSNQILGRNANVILGNGAGYTNSQTGFPIDNNVYIGQEVGYSDTLSSWNVFIGSGSGRNTISGSQNVFLGGEAGRRNVHGQANTYMGRRAGYDNREGSGNVFVGYFAGANERGSNKLYIANTETSEPLIYGDFNEKRIKLWADTLAVEGKTSSRDGYSAGGEDGITDTLFAITAFDFVNAKIKFRKQVIKGGIVVEMTGESEWMDSINRQYLFCNDGLTDKRDGKTYLTVMIGTQCWMAENLNVGARIDRGTYLTDNGVIEKHCYDDNEANCTTWGGLYSWNELMQYRTTPGTQGICPDGWHVPTDAEYKILEGTVDSEYGVGDAEWDGEGWRGFDAGLNLRSTVGWADDGNGTDAFGFQALPGGRLIRGGDYDGSDSSAWFWTSSLLYPSGVPYIRHLSGDSDDIDRDTLHVGNSFSLRCLKGKGIQAPSVTTRFISDITDTTATCGGTVTADGGAPVIARGVVWSTGENPTLDDSFTTDGSGTGPFTSNLTDLINDTDYYVRAYATNSAGTAYGELVGFSTRGEACPGIPEVVWQGKTYHTVMIGAQCWLKENLDVGSMIHVGLNQTDNNIIEKYCYQNDPVNCDAFGGLYQWQEMMQYTSQQGAQGICPDGWHVSSDDEWKVLEGTADSQYDATDPVWANTGFRGYDAGKNLKSITGWNNNGNGTDLYGFAGLGSGFAWAGSGFGYMSSYAAFWTSSAIDGTDNAWDRGLFEATDGVDRWVDCQGCFGQSVRCVNDSTALPTVSTADVTDITESTATCGGEVISGGGSVVTARGVVWGTSEYPTLNDNHTTDGDGTGAYTSSITGLSSSTPYYVRAYATNAIGTGYGPQVRFTSDGEPCSGMPTVTYEGQTYHTVLIGTQCWLKENMNVGTMISGTSEQTDNGITEKYCYNDEPANCDFYGALYQWDEAMQYGTTEGARGICPDGWHVPADWELKILEGTADSQYGVGDPEWDLPGCRGFDAGYHLRSSTEWGTACNGTNLSGFKALPAGSRNPEGSFTSIGESTTFWSSSQREDGSVWPRNLSCQGKVCRDYDDIRFGWAVRCLKDE